MSFQKFQYILCQIWKSMGFYEYLRADYVHHQSQHSAEKSHRHVSSLPYKYSIYRTVCDLKSRFKSFSMSTFQKRLN